MSTLESVVVNGREYTRVIEDDQVVGIKRFSEKHKMWVVVRFTESVSNQELELLALLTAEYIKQQALLSDAQ